MENMPVYVNALRDSLGKKLDVIKELLEKTQRQNEILKQETPDMEAFEALLQRKDELLRETEELDRGFEALYAKIGVELEQEKYTYKSEILEMQNLVRAIADCGMRIEGLEKENKELFQSYLNGARKEIREFKVSNKTAASYYQNMANQHREWQSYFMDQKK